MRDELIVEVLRAGHVESCHVVSAVMVDASGDVTESWGDPTRHVLPRSALKPIQALPLVESGASDAYSVTEAELAIACGTHGGEPAHVATIDGWLGRLGLGADDLECGAHAPTHRQSADALVAEGLTFDARHNNCSGKHCGFLCVVLHLGLPRPGYLAPSHPLHLDHLTPVIEEVCGLSFAGQTPAVEGCGIPVWSIPLERVAAGWAGLARRPGGRRLLDAMTARPDMVGGTDSLCTRLMAEAGARVAVKTGAEGMYCAVDRESGAGIALKAHDGSSRAAEEAIVWVLGRTGAIGEKAPTVLRNWSGTVVGEIRIVG